MAKVAKLLLKPGWINEDLIWIVGENEKLRIKLGNVG